MLIVRILAVLFPILVIVALGYLYARRYPTDMGVANRLNMDIFTPALVFGILADANFRPADYQALIVGGTLLILGSGVGGWLLARFLKQPNAVLLPALMFRNTANMGMPIALFAFGENILPATVILFITATVLHFTLGLYIMTRRAHWSDLLQMPIIWATIAGFGVNLSGLHLPASGLQPLTMLGQIAIPLMLFALGVRMLDMDFRHWKLGLIGALYCPLAGALMFLLIAPWLALDAPQSGLLLIYAVLPPAVINYMLAERYHQGPQQVAAMVMLGNLLSLVSLPIALAFALPATR